MGRGSRALAEPIARAARGLEGAAELLRSAAEGLERLVRVVEGDVVTHYG